MSLITGLNKHLTLFSIFFKSKTFQRKIHACSFKDVR